MDVENNILKKQNIFFQSHVFSHHDYFILRLLEAPLFWWNEHCVPNRRSRVQSQPCLNFFQNSFLLRAFTLKNARKTVRKRITTITNKTGKLLQFTNASIHHRNNLTPHVELSMFCPSGKYISQKPGHSSENLGCNGWSEMTGFFFMKNVQKKTRTLSSRLTLVSLIHDCLSLLFKSNAAC